MVSAGTRGERTKRSFARSEPGLVRRASAWTVGQDPVTMSLAELEDAVGIRWVDIHDTHLRSARSLGKLNRICEGMLTQRMARDLATPRRFPAAGAYEPTIRMTAAFLVRHVQPEVNGDGPVVAAASVLKPVQLLVGGSWLLSAWLPGRLFRGPTAALEADSDDSDRLHRAVAATWPDSGYETAAELAELIRRELEVASGHRTRAV